MSLSRRMSELFTPAALFNKEFEQDLKSTNKSIPLLIAFERHSGSISRFETRVSMQDPIWVSRSKRYIERMVKFLLWGYGARRIYLGGSDKLAKYIAETYSAHGERKFDYDFMSRVYLNPLEVVSCGLDDVPESTKTVSQIGRHLDGCRIGFDLGASDLKVSAVVDGETVFSKEIEWQPSIQSDPTYHKTIIRNALKLAAQHLSRLDGIGGSSAGVIIDNQPRIASLFRGVPEAAYDKVQKIFLELEDEFGVPLLVINDGEVSALAGAMSLEDTGILGLALGSSLAAGYIDKRGNLTDYLNELSFAPIDFSRDAPVDEWSGDMGVGVNYLSQQAVIRLIKQSEIQLPSDLSPASKLKYIQSYLEKGHNNVLKIWETIGVYLGYALAQYANYYEFKHVLAMGRVTSGLGGEIILENARKVLKQEFPDLFEKFSLHLPDDNFRRVGQAIAAASLPKLEREK